MDLTASTTLADPTVAKGRSKNFTKEDQIALCHAWLEVSEDPLVGNDQSGAEMLDSGHEDRSREASSIQIH